VALLAVANVGVFIFGIAPPKEQLFKATIQPARNEKPVEVERDTKLPFSQYEYEKRAIRNAIEPRIQMVQPEEKKAVDADSFQYMGRIKTGEATDTYFVKEKQTNRVYTISCNGSQGRILSIDDTRIIFEIGGRQYEVKP
jgi:hypothetical protein